MLNQSTVYVHVDGTCIILYGRIVNQIQNIYTTRSSMESPYLIGCGYVLIYIYTIRYKTTPKKSILILEHLPWCLKFSIVAKL